MRWDKREHLLHAQAYHMYPAWWNRQLNVNVSFSSRWCMSSGFCHWVRFRWRAFQSSATVQSEASHGNRSHSWCAGITSVGFQQTYVNMTGSPAYSSRQIKLAITNLSATQNHVLQDVFRTEFDSAVSSAQNVRSPIFSMSQTYTTLCKNAVVNMRL